MPVVFRIIAATIYAFIGILQFVMLIRAVLSWFPSTQSSMISQFCILVTEPFIAPVRFMLSHFSFMQGLPFDLSFLVTFILLSLLESFLPVIK